MGGDAAPTPLLLAFGHFLDCLLYQLEFISQNKYLLCVLFGGEFEALLDFFDIGGVRFLGSRTDQGIHHELGGVVLDFLNDVLARGALCQAAY